MHLNLEAQVERRAAVIAEKDNIRRQAGEEIERLIALLDRLEGDPDLEPYLSGTPLTGGDDREVDYEDEPLLGWTDPESRTGRYVHGDVPDGEDEHDGREPDDDLEPSLAGPDYSGSGEVDLEADTADDEPLLGWCEVEARWGRYSEDGRADKELAVEPSSASRKRLRRRRKAGKTVANVEARRHPWRGGIELAPRGENGTFIPGRTVY